MRELMQTEIDAGSEMTPFQNISPRSKHRVLSALFCVLLAAGGCQSQTVTHEEAQSVLLSRIDVRQQLNQTSVQLDASLAALNEITDKQAEDLVAAFTKYGVQVDALDASVADLNHACASAKAQTDAYFETAATKIELIQDADLKARATDRRQKAMALADTINGDTRTVELAYQLFVQRLRDIQAYLAADLTSGSVRSIQDQFVQTNSDVAPVRAKSDRLAYDLELGNELMNTGTIRPATTSTPASTSGSTTDSTIDSTGANTAANTATTPWTTTIPWTNPPSTTTIPATLPSQTP